MSEKNLIERAFELASEGNCRSVDDIRRKLTAERFGNVEAHLGGTTIRKQLKALIKKRADSGGDAGPVQAPGDLA